MATVYDKSSLFLAPSGVSNGTVFVQKPVPIYGSEQVTNGDFSQTGAEQVTNGDFATDTNWNKTNSVISGGVATITSVGYAFAAIVQTNVLTVGKRYKATIDVKSVTGGLIVGGTSDTITSSGIISVYFTASQTYLEIKRDGVYATTIAEIGNVSVKEVGQDWTLGTGWSIGEDKATSDGASGNLDQNGTYLSGTTYKVVYTIEDYVSGDTRFRFTGASNENGTLRNSNGTYTEYIVLTNTQSLLRFIGSGVLSITNISVQEVLSPDGDFTFTRGSNLSATRVNEAQLIEKGRENLVLQSNQFDTTWTTQNASVTSGQSGYDGTSDAWLLTKTGANGRIYQNISSSGVQTFSVYAKANASNWIALWTNIGTSYFDLSSGTKGSTGASTTIGSAMESVGNGWYRCSLIFNTSISNVRIYPADGDLDTSGTSGSVYIQDAQLEQGLAATSVITTGGGTAQAGLLENTPRLDYSGGATCPSLLLEPSRSNLVTQSEYTGGYNGINITQEFNALVSPEGAQNAVKIETTSTGQCHLRTGFTAATGNYVGSVFIKKQDFNYIYMELGGAYAWFNINDGTKGNSGFYGSDWTYVDHSVEDYGNGWYRCALVGNCLTAGGYNFRSIQPVSGNGSYNSNLSGGLTYFYGAQVEQGSYSTSYIPTYGTSQTRAADDTGTLDLSLIGLDGQDVTHFIEFKNNQSIIRDSGSTSFRFSSDTANFGSFRIYRSASTAKQLTVVFQDTNGGFSNPGGYEMTSLNPKVAIKRVWATGEIKVFVDGNKVIEASSTLFNSWNKVDMEGTGSTIEVKQLVSFPTVLSDLDCEILTGATTYETFEEMALALNYTVYE